MYFLIKHVKHKTAAFVAAGLARYSIVSVILLMTILVASSCRVKMEAGRVSLLRDKIVALAKSLIGLPYKYGGDDIDGFDCSGFVYYVYDSFGIEIPRTAKKQAKLRGKISFEKAKPGDILVFKLKRREWHAGIFLNKKCFIHAPNKKEWVREEELNSYWLARLERVIGIIDE